jgi:hypothetical protein
MHPREKELLGKKQDQPDPTCFNCQKVVDSSWKACPYCGTRLVAPKEAPQEVL